MNRVIWITAGLIVGMLIDAWLWEQKPKADTCAMWKIEQAKPEPLGLPETKDVVKISDHAGNVSRFEDQETGVICYLRGAQGSRSPWYISCVMPTTR